MIKRTLIALLVAVSLIAADWPAFRGPHGNGAGEGRGLPVRWGPKEKMIWKAALPGPGCIQSHHLAGPDIRDLLQRLRRAGWQERRSS